MITNLEVSYVLAVYNINIEFIDKRKLNAFIRAVNKASEAMPGIARDVFSKYNKIVENGLKNIAADCVDEYYSYPTKYHRKGDMKNTYEILVNDEKWEISTSEKNMKFHGDLDKYIYDRMFVEGYHGGADKGPKHPDPGTPWLRGGVFGVFSYWLRPASQTDSVEDMIHEQADTFIKEMYEERENAIVDKFSPYYNNLIDTYNNLLL